MGKKPKGQGKGAAWEREISSLLTEWVSGQRKEKYFYRSPGSGAVATINLGNKAISGDIIALKPEGSFFIDVFSVEAKNGYPTASLDKHLKANKNDTILDFWKQANRDAVLAEKHPLLIFKKKGNPNPWIGFCDRAHDKVKDLLSDLRCVMVTYPNEGVPPLFLYDIKEVICNRVLTPDLVKERFNCG